MQECIWLNRWNYKLEFNKVEYIFLLFFIYIMENFLLCYIFLSLWTVLQKIRHSRNSQYLNNKLFKLKNSYKMLIISITVILHNSLHKILHKLLMLRLITIYVIKMVVLFIKLFKLCMMISWLGYKINFRLLLTV